MTSVASSRLTRRPFRDAGPSPAVVVGADEWCNVGSILRVFETATRTGDAYWGSAFLEVEVLRNAGVKGSVVVVRRHGELEYEIFGDRA